MRITQLEEEEERLHDEDKHFWQAPRHDSITMDSYEKRRERLVDLRKELTELYDELAEHS